MPRKIIQYIPWNDGVSVTFDTGEEMVFWKSEIAEAYDKYWWSFVKALGLALYRADGANTAKILTYWTEYAKEYIEKFLYPIRKKQSNE